MAGKREERMKEITERLEQGVKELFTSENYTAYLKTMAQFHNYSFNNTVLIMMQKPDATLVAGYNAWKKKFNRQVKSGEKGIQIIAPVPVKIREEVEKSGPETDELALRPDGQPETEVVEHVIPRFRTTTVFDISQTEGDPLPEIDAPELMGSVENFETFMEAIQMTSPVPIRYGHISGESKGFYSNTDEEIVIRGGMSERHTMKTAVHEVTHAMCHDRDLMEELGERKGQTTREVEAESVAYTVCQYFGLDTSDYSFPYIAGWSSDMEMKELRSSMEFIRKTAGSLIDSISENIQAIQRGQQDKEHLEENDLVLKVVFPLTDMFTYMVVENMDREELLAQLQSYHELYGNSGEMTVETFLEGQGARLIPWYDSASLMVEKPVSFFDFEYEYDTGIVDAEALPIEEQAEMLISRAEYQGTVFDGQDRDLIKEYAKKFDDMDAVKGLIRELAEAEKDSYIQAAQKIRSHARAEMDKFPDRTLGLSAMHWMGCHDDSMLPLTRERALELYRAGLDIYSLQADGRAFLMALEGDFYEEKGIFGVKAEEWESYRELEAEPEPGLAYGSRKMPEPFIAQYYVMHDTVDGERECQYFESLNAAFIAYHQIPNHLDKQIGMESTEQSPTRMSLIKCRNGIETLTDIKFCSLSGKWVRRETMEASEKAGKYLEGCYKEIAYRTGKGYFSIQTVSDGYDYTIYDRKFREIDGGVYDNPDIGINEAMEDILSDAGIPMGACKAIDYEKLQEKVEAVAQDDLKKGQEKAPGRKLPLISGQTEPENALNGQSRAEIEEMALCYAQAQIDEMGLSGEVELLGARVYGSRSREGMYREGSDVDVALSYSGSIQEDVFFNVLHEGSFEIAGIPVDINPISTEKTGTLEEYLEDADRRLDEKRWQELTGEIVKFSMDYGEDLLGFWDGTAEIETEPIYQAHEIIYNALARSDTEKFQAHLEEVLKINDAGSPAAEDAARLLEKITGKRIEPQELDAKISFYVAECMEFPVLGEYHENIKTLQEAMELYEKIPANRMNGVKGIGFCLEDGSIYAGKFELMSGREVLTDIINDIPYYKKSPLVQKAVADMEAILSGQGPCSMTENEKKPERRQKSVGNPKAAQKNVEIKAAARQKAGEKTPAASRKQSVLNAVRERQARMKEEKQGQKAQAHRKAVKKSGIEL